VLNAFLAYCGVFYPLNIDPQYQKYLWH